MHIDTQNKRCYDCVNFERIELGGSVMAEENILSFYKYIENDPKVFKKMGKLEQQPELPLEKFSQKVSKIAHKAGFEFTSNELIEYLKEKKNITSENQLQVAGGTGKRIVKDPEELGFSKGELAVAKVVKRAILNDFTDKADIFYQDNYNMKDL